MKGNSFFSLILVICALIVSTSFVNATESRLRSMSNPWLYMEDNSNIFHFPGTLADYPGIVAGELRNRDDENSYTFGVNFPLTSTSLYALYFNNPINLYIPDGVTGYEDEIADVSVDENVSLNRALTFMYGVDLGAMKTAFGIDFAMDYFSDNGDPSEMITEKILYFKPTAGISSDLYDLGFFIEIPIYSYLYQYEQEYHRIGGNDVILDVFLDDLEDTDDFYESQGVSSRAELEEIIQTTIKDETLFENKWNGVTLGANARGKIPFGAMTIVPAARLKYSPSTHIDDYNTILFIEQLEDYVENDLEDYMQGRRDIVADWQSDGDITTAQANELNNRINRAESGIERAARSEELFTDFQETEFTLGIGTNYEINSRNLLFVGIDAIDYRSVKSIAEIKGIQTETYTVEDNDLTLQEFVVVEAITKQTTIVIPRGYIAFESRILDWLALRSGANYGYIRTHQYTEVDEDILRDRVDFVSEFNFSLGTGFDFKNFTVDLHHERQVFFDGPNFISGTESPLSSSLSLVYKFK